MDIYKIANYATYRALTNVYRTWTDSISEDMFQAAFLKCLVILSEKNVNRSYLEKAAYHAALSEFFYVMNEDSIHDREKRGLSYAPLFSNLKDDNEDKQYILENRKLELVNLFYENRNKKGDRGLKASETDAEICILIERGVNTRDIADILGLTINHVKTRRKRIRELLKTLV